MRALLRRAERPQRRTRHARRADRHRHARPRRARRRHARRADRKQFALLVHLAAEPTRVFTKGELLRDVWGYRGARQHAHAGHARLPAAPEAHAPPTPTRAGCRTSGASATGSRPIGEREPDPARGMKRTTPPARRTPPRRTKAPAAAHAAAPHDPARAAHAAAPDAAAVTGRAPVKATTDGRGGPAPPPTPSARRSSAAPASSASRPRASRPRTSPPRGMGGCEHPDCVVPMCWTAPPRLRHRPARPAAATSSRAGGPRSRTPSRHLGLISAYRRLTGGRLPAGDVAATEPATKREHGAQPTGEAAPRNAASARQP